MVAATSAWEPPRGATSRPGHSAARGIAPQSPSVSESTASEEVWPSCKDIGDIDFLEWRAEYLAHRPVADLLDEGRAHADNEGGAQSSLCESRRETTELNFYGAGRGVASEEASQCASVPDGDRNLQRRASKKSANKIVDKICERV